MSCLFDTNVVIAATAITFDFTLVARNIEDVAALPVKALDPRTFGGGR